MARMLENDEAGSLRGTLRVAQSDLINLLGEFMDVKKLDMGVEKADGGYKLTITADIGRIYEVGKTT